MKTLLLKNDDMCWITPGRLYGTNITGSIEKSMIYPTMPPKYKFHPSNGGESFFIFESEFIEERDRLDIKNKARRKWKSR